MLCSKISFSYWVICDTGSTDDTCEIIQQFFKDINIPGELHEHKWLNFAHNRTLALNIAFNKTDLLFIFDADDEIHGEINMPSNLNNDAYLLNFGYSTGISYQRILLVNNRIKWNYQSVVHEYINCLMPNPKIVTLEGDYYIVSGRKGSRSSDPNKYLNDAKMLEAAYFEAKTKNDPLYIRYGFYCANSYKDAGKSVEAIKWYKIALNNENWSQEKYMCCFNLYNEYNKLGEKEKGIYYLVESFKYDTERTECAYILIQYYLSRDLYQLAYQYYGLIKNFYENKYLDSNTNGKLFVEQDKSNFYLPYYMILVADKVKNTYPDYIQTIIKMYEIVFVKKYPINDDFFIGNLLYNLQFFIESCVSYKPFIELFQSYIDFLYSRNCNINKHLFLKQFEKHGIKLKTIENTFSQDECKNSNKILFYSGFSNVQWNYTYCTNKPLGGSETALANLVKSFPTKFDIYVCGTVAEEIVDNVNYINLDTLKKMITSTPFHTIIVSRYIGFYEMFSNISFYQSFIWGHDISLYPYGCDLDVTTILKKWSHKITGCVCQTEWHKNTFIQQYPSLKDKMFVVNNGIVLDKFIYKPIKISNRFIYTSCSERGLDKLLELWPKIIESLPSAELCICSYNNFPQNDYEKKLDEIIKQYNSIKHLGCLNKPQLYELMSSAEYWLYPTNFSETSCITAMEMLMSEVICIYYPIAGLVNTVGDYGIPVENGNELNTILNLSTNKKNELMKNGKKYALSCSWENRANEWINIINDLIIIKYGILNNNINITEYVLQNLTKEDCINIPHGDDYRESLFGDPEYGITKSIFIMSKTGSIIKEFKNNEDVKYFIKPVNNIKIINLKNNNERRTHIEKQFQQNKITNYDFFDAIDGKAIKETEELCLLFERNDFNYRKGDIGCALSHIFLWNELINNKQNDFYIILEDDVNICDNFKDHLDKVCNLFIEQKLEYLALGEYHSNKQFPSDNNVIEIYSKDIYNECNTNFAYIISKDAAKKILKFINNCSLKCAIDNPQAYGYILKYHTLNFKLVDCKIVNEFGTNIQNSINNNHFIFNNKITEIKTITISFCDWWKNEYSGGLFDKNNNFFTNLLRDYGNNYIINLIEPDRSPNILFYSIFGDSHKNYKADRKIFFSGEPYGIREDADYNITFDENSLNNVRIPLWVCYFDNALLDECNKRKNNTNIIPSREKFCSFIASGPGLANNRKEFVEKLSDYKVVDCGGNYLNNIGGPVPLGINCSGKISYNNNYKFAMAFESTSYPGYVTEKICDVYKSNCIPIYWGNPDIMKDFNPTTFINANDFPNFDELIKYIIKIDNNEVLYKSFFKEPMLKNKWLDILSDPNKCFFKNVADNIIGSHIGLFDNFLKNTFQKNQTILCDSSTSKKTVNIFNIWHNKLFDNCYEKLDEYSLNKIIMYDVNSTYQKIYNKNKKYNIIKEYELDNYNNLLQSTNYCQTSCLYHIYLNDKSNKYPHLYDNNYIGFIQYDMVLDNDFIYDIEHKINNNEHNIFFYSLVANDKLDRHLICLPYGNSILEQYNNHFNTNHTYETIKNHKRSKYFICLHTFVIPINIYIKMMKWYCSISDWLHINYINGFYKESMSEVSEEIFGLFLIIQIIENDNIQLEELKLKHNWPNLHNETEFNNYKENISYFPLSSIVNTSLTDKHSYHSYIDVYEELFKHRQLTTKNILEIGIERGGYLKLWNDYFVNAQIYGLDINCPPSFLSQYNRIITKTSNAYCLETLNYFIENNVKFDIIIDDGPHTLDSMVYIIENYTHLLNNNGILIIEDIQSIDWCEIMLNKVPNNLKKFSYHIDRRHIKGTLDDILFIVENKENIKINKYEEQIKNNDLWVMYADNNHNYKVIEDYINNLKKRYYNIIYTKDVEFVLNCNPNKISFVMNILDDRICNKYKHSNIELSLLNTEPLSITYNLELLKKYINKYPYLKIYDYSYSNVQIILKNNMSAKVLEYTLDEKENRILMELNSNKEKLYDFGIITYGNTETNTINCLFHKKKDVVSVLIKKGFKIHIISGWGLERDNELAKCKIILNIHSIIGFNGHIYYSKTFESIRCIRLLDAGFKILSEDSINSNELTNKYKNLKFLDYDNFKNIEYSENFWDIIKNNDIKKYCFIHSCNLENVGTYRLDYLVDKLNKTGCINVFNKIYINNIGLPIDNKYGEKFEVINYSENSQLFENPTINFIQKFSQNNSNCYILYLHTKGISFPKDNNKENDWINYMLYFLVEQHKLCISILDNYYDTVGCNYSNDLDKDCFKHTHPFPEPHYNGNFWWANTNYLQNLSSLSLENINRNAPDFWLFKNEPVFYNLHSSNVNHYHNEYPRYLYTDK